MKCLSPVDCWIVGEKVCKDGVTSPNLIFSPNEALKKSGSFQSFMNAYVPQPCGKCAACQIMKRKDMTTRIAHEVAMHDECCFITLTYNDDYIPVVDGGLFDRGIKNGISSLLPLDVQKFIKRLRRHLEYVPKLKKGVRDHLPSGKLRYFAVGEYGGKTHRPHYHILIFGWKPSDLKVHELKANYEIYRSSQIEKLWKYGFSTVCSVNYGVAKYCARYVTKKFARLSQPSPIDDIVCSEFSLQSTRNGGIGSPWLEKYYHDLFTGFVLVATSADRISKNSIPRYYYNRLRKINIPVWLELRDMRIDFVKSHVGVSKNTYADLKRFVKKNKYLDELAIAREII